MNPISTEPPLSPAPAGGQSVEKSTRPPVSRARKEIDRRNWHLQILAVSVVIVAIAMILQVRADQRVYVTGLSGLPLPESCGMQIMFRQSCPGCGLTRSFIYLFHGDWQRSFAIHRVGWVLALLLVCQIPYRLIALNYPVVNVGPHWTWITGSLLGVAIIANWIYNLLQMNGAVG